MFCLYGIDYFVYHYIHVGNKQPVSANNDSLQKMILDSTILHNKGTNPGSLQTSGLTRVEEKVKFTV